ncbi:MAG TPA: cell division protein ZapA [Bryobacteraceae bacterium]|nr:cell division protein ZapA [Bryobacteraceae bacterium]
MANDAPLDKKTVRVTIFNQSYSLVTTGSEADVEDLAHRVDELMTNIARGSNTDASRIAVLACMHLADELRTAESKHRTLSRLLEESLTD